MPTLLKKLKTNLDWIKNSGCNLKIQMSGLLHHKAGGERRNHPAPFPLELPSRLIRAFTFKGETVLDPFLGSGTTLISAAALGRNGIGYEINPLIARQALNFLEAENARQIDMESITKCNT